MEFLNDDCLCLIFDHLDLRDQISASRTCVFLEAFCRDLWQRKFLKFHWTFDSNADLKDFYRVLQLISKTVEILEFRCLEHKSFELLKSFKFPLVKHLSFTQWAKFNDEHIMQMNKLFPNLKYFSPHGSFSGKYMDNWKTLKSLNLNFCPNLTFKELDNILKQTELTSLKLGIFEKCSQLFSLEAIQRFYKLESIFLNTSELIWMEKLNKFKHLKELTLADRDAADPLKKFLTNLQKYKCNNVVEIETQVCLQNINEFTNLRRLVLAAMPIQLEMLPQLRSLFNLRTIIFINALFDQESVISGLLTNCTQLEYISIEHCFFPMDVLTIDVPKLVADREKLLLFNFIQNKKTEKYVTLDIKGSSPLLKISTNVSTPFSYNPIYIKFEND